MLRALCLLIPLAVCSLFSFVAGEAFERSKALTGTPKDVANADGRFSAWMSLICLVIALMIAVFVP